MIVNEEMEQLLREGFNLQQEIERLKTGKVLREKIRGQGYWMWLPLWGESV